MVSELPVRYGQLKVNFELSLTLKVIESCFESSFRQNRRHTASKISSFIKFTAESRHNRSRGTDQCDNNIIVDTAYCNVVSFNKIFAFH